MQVIKAIKLDELTKSINSDIVGGLDKFLLAGEKLKKIRDGNLFIPSHETFASYCDGEIIWGKSHSYSSILVFEKCGQILYDHPELMAAGQTKIIRLLKYMKDEETTKNLLHMAANTPAKGFEANMKNLAGEIAHDDPHEHDFQPIPYEQCSICGQKRPLDSQK